MTSNHDIDDQMPDNRSHEGHTSNTEDMLNRLHDTAVTIMTFVVDGRVSCPQHWCKLFTAISQIIILQQYLSSVSSDHGKLSLEFMQQADMWMNELTCLLN